MTLRIARLTGRSRSICFESCRQPAQLGKVAPGSVVQGADDDVRLTTTHVAGPQGGYFCNRQPTA